MTDPVDPSPRISHPAEPAQTEDPADWAASLYQKLSRSGSLYRKESDGTMYLIESGRQPVLIGDFSAFCGLIHSIVRFTRPLPDGREARCFPLHFQMNLLYHTTKTVLPNIRTIIYEPAVVFSSARTPRVTPEGYDPITEIFYWRPPNTLPFTPRSSTEHLAKCFSGVPFETPGHKANVIAALLGALVIDNNHESPLFAVSGNQPGIGKTKLCAAMGYILLGSEPSPVSPGAKEMAKEIGARFRESKRFILLDNVVMEGNKGYCNNQLAALLTQGHSKRVRELGFSRSVSQEGVLFALTANHCSLHEDLAVRALVVKLYRTIVGEMNPYVLDYAKEHRTELFEELLGLALRTTGDYPLPDGHASSFRFRSWLRFVWPRITPHFGLLSLEESGDLDIATRNLFSWGYSQLKETPTFEFDLSSLILYINTSTDDAVLGLKDRLAGCDTPRSKQVTLGIMITNLMGKPMTVTHGVTMTIERVGKCSPTKYLFRVLEDTPFEDDTSLPAPSAAAAV